MVTGSSCPAAASTSALSRRSSLSAEPAGLARAEFARPSPGRAPNRDFSFPCYISPVAGSLAPGARPGWPARPRCRAGTRRDRGCAAVRPAAPRNVLPGHRGHRQQARARRRSRRRGPGRPPRGTGPAAGAGSPGQARPHRPQQCPAHPERQPLRSATTGGSSEDHRSDRHRCPGRHAAGDACGSGGLGHYPSGRQQPEAIA